MNLDPPTQKEDTSVPVKEGWGDGRRGVEMREADQRSYKMKILMLQDDEKDVEWNYIDPFWP